MSRQRLYQYDVIRALAIIMVVAVHCLPPEWAPLVGHTSCKSFVRLSKALLLTCNPLFFMMSGKFNIRPLADTELDRYYYRRVRGVLVPTLIYAAIYTVWYRFPNVLPADALAMSYLRNVLGVLSDKIFWFVCTLFGMLLVAPYLAQGLRSIGRRGQMCLMGIWLVWSTCHWLGANLDFYYNWSFPLGGFFFFFCLGAFVEDSFLNDLSTRTLAVVGFLAWFVNGTLAYFGWEGYAYDRSPLYGITAICLYLFLVRRPWNHSERVRGAVSFVATNSFGIYLMHALLVWPVTDLLEPLLDVWGPLFFACHFPLTFLGGLAMALVCDNLLVRPAQALMDKAFLQKVELHAAGELPAHGR